MADEPRFHDLLDPVGRSLPDDRLIRPWAQRGNADHGYGGHCRTLVIPEVDRHRRAGGLLASLSRPPDADMLVTTEILPLRAAIDLVTEQFDAHRERTDQAAQLFPCA